LRWKISNVTLTEEEERKKKDKGDKREKGKRNIKRRNIEKN
jgi:hypothetical protein